MDCSRFCRSLPLGPVQGAGVQQVCPPEFGPPFLSTRAWLWEVCPPVALQRAARPSHRKAKGRVCHQRTHTLLPSPQSTWSRETANLDHFWPQSDNIQPNWHESDFNHVNKKVKKIYRYRINSRIANVRMPFLCVSENQHCPLDRNLFSQASRCHPRPRATVRQSPTCAVGRRAGPGPVGGAEPRHEPRGPVALPAGVDHRAGEQDAVTADNHAVGGRARVPAGHGWRQGSRDTDSDPSLSL